MKTTNSRKNPLLRSETVSIHDTNRYIIDDYVSSIALRETINRYSIGINIINAKTGVSACSEYWHFKLSEKQEAITTYEELVKRIKSAVQYIEYEEIPIGLVQPIVTKAVRDLDNDHKELTGVFHVNISKTKTDVESDWRETLYGQRYPRSELNTMQSMQNNNEISKSVVTDNSSDTRDRIVKYKKSDEEEEMTKFAAFDKLAQFNYIRELIQRKWPTISAAAILSFIAMFLNIPGNTMELLANEVKNNPDKVKNMIPEVQPDYTYKHQGKLQGLQPDFRQKVESVLTKLKNKGWQPIVAEGLRTQKEQAEKVRQKRSKTMNSKHLLGLAVDVVDHRYGWEGKASNTKFQFWQDLGEAAKSEGLEWGGDWGFLDVAHIQGTEKQTPRAQTQQIPTSSISKAFASSLVTTLEIEKGYGKNKHDRGGATNKGITLQTYLNWLKKHKLPTSRIDMKTIPDAHVQSIYKEEYWDVIHGDQLPPVIAQQLFDFAVNTGNQRAIRTLQSIVDGKRVLSKSLKTIGEESLANAILANGKQTELTAYSPQTIQKLQQLIGTKPDGKLGPKTTTAFIAALSPEIQPDGRMGPKTVEAINAYIVKNSTNQLAMQLLQEREKYLKSLPDWKHFGNGWSNRLETMQSKIPSINAKPMPRTPEKFTKDFSTPQTDIWQYEFPENNV